MGEQHDNETGRPWNNYIQPNALKVLKTIPDDFMEANPQEKTLKLNMGEGKYVIFTAESSGPIDVLAGGLVQMIDIHNESLFKRLEMQKQNERRQARSTCTTSGGFSSGYGGGGATF